MAVLVAGWQTLRNRSFDALHSYLCGRVVREAEGGIPIHLKKSPYIWRGLLTVRQKEPNNFGTINWSWIPEIQRW